MSMISKKWQVAPSAPSSLLNQYSGMSPIVAQLLYNRGLQTPKEAYHFLYDRDVASTSGDPRHMKDMEKAIARIRKAIKNNEAIVVYGDFDADGVTSTTLMMEVLSKLKANVSAYIPHRVDEGYGLNTPALQELAENGAKLVITVDCGIRAVEEVEEANAVGLDMIITDHHSIGPEIPPAYAVVNPQQVDCSGDKNLAGVGVAFMTARALLLDALDRNGKNKNHAKIYKNILDNLLDLVAIGTVADVMNLNTPTNRALVRQGLEVINQANRPGIRALMEVAGLKQGTVTAMGIGFGLGPRINAAGRLDSAIEAYKLLSAQDDEEAQKYAERLQNFNKERQHLTRESQTRIRTNLEEKIDLNEAQLIFAVDENIVPGIVGLVAGRLTEEFFRPTVVVEKGEQECHASCRSIPQFHITQALDECADILVRHGGHAMAAGLTVLPENLDLLQERLQEKARAVLDGMTLQPTIHVDMELSLREATMALAKELAVLEPTGHANEQAVFMSRKLRVLETKTVGKDKSHLKVKLVAEGEPPIDCIGFRLGHWVDDLPEYVDVVYNLEVNEWLGRRNLQLNLRDIRPAEDA
ncbi:MAG: single-stranded-DNA-specific exonuclease RecJ [Phototrophicaceae bacterium]